MIHLNIGSNLNSSHGDKFVNISLTIKLLLESKVEIKKVSNLYETPSYPNKRLPKFVNVGLMINYSRDHLDLLNLISTIEKKMGRTKTTRNDPRVCDIDIIDFKGLVYFEKNLKLPHPRCHLRNFVLYPIKQIDPNWTHPIMRKNVDFLINSLSQGSRIEITRLNKSVII
tara:strand:- start:374 stop:883 length:510 start_codon:yes stop_codon:yes gene_type:complete